MLEQYKIENDVYKCECGKCFTSPRSLNSHFRYCDKHKPIDKSSIYKINDNLYKCECGKEFDNCQSLNAHFSHCKFHCEKINKQFVYRDHIVNHKMCGWNKFTEEEKQEIHEKTKTTLKEKYKDGLLIPYWNNDNDNVKNSRLKLSETMSKLREEGKSFCRGAMGYYKGIHCDSSWELAYVLYCLDNNIKISRCRKRFTYEYEGKMHLYTPDFIVNDSEIIEIKGYKDKHWEEKIKCCIENNITIIDKEDIKPYLKYAKNTYGKDFIKLYK